MLALTAAIAITFLLAGIVKGVTGMDVPTPEMGFSARSCRP